MSVILSQRSVSTFAVSDFKRELRPSSFEMPGTAIPQTPRKVRSISLDKTLSASESKIERDSDADESGLTAV
jgi:hypothetical protein